MRRANAGGVRVSDERFQSRRLGAKDRSSERRQFVITPACVVPIGIKNKLQVDKPGQGRIQRAGAHLQLARRPLRHLEQDAVTVARPVYQGQQDVELLRRERQEMARVVHTSVDDISSLDVLRCTKVG